MPNMFTNIAVAVLVFSLFGTGEAAVTWTTPAVTNGIANDTKVLKEDATNGAVIITLAASDADSYKIEKQPIDGMFAVAGSGELTLANNALLDYEKIRSYTLTVIATKTVGSMSSIPAVITINVEDVNDNTPKFEQTEYSKTISNNTAKGEEIIQVHATDKDISPAFNTLQYTIEGGDVDSFFEIVPADGKIKSKKLVTVPKVTTYNLTVQAEDNSAATPKLHGTANVLICVGCLDSGAGHTGALAVVMSLAVLLAVQF